MDSRDEHEKNPLPRAPYLLQGIRHPSAVNTNTIRARLRWISEQSGARHADGSQLILTPHDCRCVFASEHFIARTTVHVIQALLGHATINTVMIYAKLYPDQFVTDYRKAMRGLGADVCGPSANTSPTEAEWADVYRGLFLAGHGNPRLRVAHRRALPPRAGLPGLRPRPTQEECPAGLRRVLSSFTRALDTAREHGEPAGLIAARELEVERIRSAVQ